MTKIAQKVLADAMTLKESERAELAARLLDTVDPAIDSDYARAWEREITKRLRELDEGQVTAIPWKEARQKIRRGARNAQAD